MSAADPAGPGAEAITAAAQVLYSRFARPTHTSGNEMLRMQDAARAALTAAWPFLQADVECTPADCAGCEYDIKPDLSHLDVPGQQADGGTG